MNSAVQIDVLKKHRGRIDGFFLTFFHYIYKKVEVSVYVLGIRFNCVVFFFIVFNTYAGILHSCFESVLSINVLQCCLCTL